MSNIYYNTYIASFPEDSYIDINPYYYFYYRKISHMKQWEVINNNLPYAAR